MGSALGKVTLTHLAAITVLQPGALAPHPPVPPRLGVHSLCPHHYVYSLANRRCLTQKWRCERSRSSLRPLARVLQGAHATRNLPRATRMPVCTALCGEAPGFPAADTLTTTKGSRMPIQAPWSSRQTGSGRWALRTEALGGRPGSLGEGKVTQMGTGGDAAHFGRCTPWLAWMDGTVMET